VGPNGATVAGTVNPNGLSTKYYFEFGTTSGYGYQTSPVTAGNGLANVAVGATLAGLQSTQTYHYRLVAVSIGGTTLGADATFKTTSTESQLRPFGHTAFVSPEGVVGVFVACLGQNPCSGSLVIARNGVEIGRRASFFIGAQDGGFVHLPLSSLGRSLVATRHRLGVNITVTGTNGQSSSTAITLVQFQ
jgi:hypothetical protein